MRTQVLAPYIYGVMAEKWGYRYKDVMQEYDGATIYPSCLLAPYKNKLHPNSYGVHDCIHGWKKKAPFFQRVIGKLWYWYVNIRFSLMWGRKIK